MPPDSQAWAQALFGQAQLGDKRRTARLVHTVASLCARPADAIPQAVERCWPAVKGAYRMLSNNQVQETALIQAMGQATARSCEGQHVVLCLQDTTFPVFPGAPEKAGLGPINDVENRGLGCHTTLAVDEQGLALGILHMQIWARSNEVGPKTSAHRNRPIEDKESMKWINGMRAAQTLLGALADPPHRIHVGDREEDMIEAFGEAEAAGDGFVIRAAQARRVRDKDSGELAWANEQVAASPLLREFTLEVAPRPGHKARRALMQLRTVQMELAPRTSHKRRLGRLNLHLVEAREIDPPASVKEPLHWRLWTNEPADDAQEAMRIVEIYKQRWKIEDFHLVLKDGCRVEALRLHTAERLAKALILYAAVALRILQLRDLGRLCPEQPCTRVLSEPEWKTLWMAIHRQKPPPDAASPTLREAVLWIGRLGGHLGRKADGMPGVRVLWRGWRDLQVMTEVFDMLIQR